MELEQNCTFFPCYDTIADTTLFHEETAEAIVPDAFPDIEQILEADGTVFWTEKCAETGKFSLSGEIQIAVLYISEQDGVVRHMDVPIPFRCGMDQDGITPESRVAVSARLVAADARALNPRKVLVRAEAAVHVTVREPREMRLLCSLDCSEDMGIQQQTHQERSLLAVHVADKPFALSDTLHLPANCQELLKVRATPVCSESKVIGSKLIFKGAVHLETVYRGTDGLENARFELPFSQVMEAANAGEESNVSMVLAIRQQSCSLDPDGNDLTVNMELLAHGLVEEERTLTVVSDVYSTAFALSAVPETIRITQLLDQLELPVSLREMVETDQPVRRIVDCHALLGQPEAEETGNQYQVTVPVTVCALCQDEADRLFPVTGTVTASAHLDRQGGSLVIRSCEWEGEAYATPAAGGIEARLPLRLKISALLEKQLAVVRDVTVDTEHPINGEGAPSVVLRPLMAGEQLWDVAKQYHTTVSDLMHANELEDGEVVGGRMLLIPKRR